MQASDIMRGLNPQALQSRESGHEVFIEDVKDPDDRWYRIEYRCRPDGSNAMAWLIYSPWNANPFPYTQSHLGSDNFICVGPGLSHTSSPYDLDYVVKRARFWCAGYSYLREHGFEATCRAIPDWRG